MTAKTDTSSTSWLILYHDLMPSGMEMPSRNGGRHAVTWNFSPTEEELKRYELEGPVIKVVSRNGEKTVEWEQTLVSVVDVIAFAADHGFFDKAIPPKEEI